VADIPPRLNRSLALSAGPRPRGVAPRIVLFQAPPPRLPVVVVEAEQDRIYEPEPRCVCRAARAAIARSGGRGVFVLRQAALRSKRKLDNVRPSMRGQRLARNNL
jgi:hypothetical protein